MPTAFARVDRSLQQWSKPGYQRADFIEICLPDSATAGSEANVLRKGHLADADIPGWIGQAPQYSTTDGGLRLLILDRQGYDLRLPLTEAMFVKVIDGFNLSQDTLDMFNSKAGAYARSCQFGIKGELSGINLILKAPQSYTIKNTAPQIGTIGNWGLSTHHDLATGVTTGVLYGTNVIVCADEADTPGRHTKEIPGHPDYVSEMLECPDHSYENTPKVNSRGANLQPTGWKLRQWLELVPTIEARKHNLRHPLALAALLLRLHAWRVRSVVEDGRLTTRTLDIQRNILFDEATHNRTLHSKSGPDEPGHGRGGEGANLFWTRTLDVDNLYTDEGRMLRDEARAMTVSLSLQAIRLSHSLRPPEWNVDCSGFLLQVARDLKESMSRPSSNTTKDGSHSSAWIDPHQGTGANHAARLSQNLEDDLQLIINISTGVVRQIKSAQQNLDIHFELANTLISQLSNEFGVQIAKDNFRDGTSMQVLAIITTLFLPGTFVATFMSVGIWNWRWQPDDPQNGEPGVVSSRWWVYVVVTAPLTVITLITWIFWWSAQINLREKRHPIRDMWKKQTSGSGQMEQQQEEGQDEGASYAPRKLFV